MNLEELKNIEKSLKNMSKDEFAEVLSKAAFSLVDRFDKDNKEKVNKNA